MSEFIDRVAHAIEQAMVSSTGEQCSRDMALILARAAIEAMEQPSRKMMEAAYEVGIDMPAEEYWRAMITAELKPE